MRNKLSLVSYLIKITGTTSKSNSNENGSRDYNKSIENINWKTCSVLVEYKLLEHPRGGKRGRILKTTGKEYHTTKYEEGLCNHRFNFAAFSYKHNINILLIYHHRSDLS